MLTRRSLLKRAFLLATPALFPGLVSCARNRDSTSWNCAQGLRQADANGVCLPPGFRSRIIAVSGNIVAGSAYRWHGSPDGGACLATDDGGWIYVSNSELSRGNGGAGAIRFDRQGGISNAYSILDNANRPCAGGMTPWGSWLACEEVAHGRVWECDPFGKRQAVTRDSLGRFAHEAAVYDTDNHYVYLTEDKADGGLYRFVPDALNQQGFADLAQGRLQVAVYNDANKSGLHWSDVPDPLARTKATRYQVADMAVFNGGEGLVYHAANLYFATKGDDRIWRYQTDTGALSLLYDAAHYQHPVLTGVDNMAISAKGVLYVAEDGGDMQVVWLPLSAQGQAAEPRALLQLPGHDSSEISGLAFSPDGSRLYFSSQRGLSGRSGDGMIFEVQGEFF